METKRCARCRETKPTIEFGSNRNTPDGLHSYCRRCINAYMNARYVKRQKREKPPLPELKRCSRCKDEKPRSEFSKASKSNRAADGLFGWCRPCTKKYEQARWARTPRKRPPKPPEGFKRCGRCKEVKPVEEFYHSNSRPDGLRAYCMPCWAVVNTASSKRYRQTAGYRNWLAKKRSDNPEFRRKYLVRMFASIAIQLGVLVRQPCEVCGSEKVQAHHTDYAKPLEVRWLCKAHHQSHGHAGDFDNPPQ